MPPFDTSKYTIERKEDGSLVRIDGLGGESPEMTVDYYDAQIEYYTQVLANLEAQSLKVQAFELENPAPIVEEPEPVESEPSA